MMVLTKEEIFYEVAEILEHLWTIAPYTCHKFFHKKNEEAKGKMSFPDSVRWKIENEIQKSLSTVIEEKDEITCRRYWVSGLDGKYSWLVWHFSDGYISIVPEGGKLGPYTTVHSSTPTTKTGEK